MTMSTYLSDLGVMLGRCLKHTFRSVDTIITVVLMPIAFLLLFVYVFGGAMRAGSGGYATYLVPGILLITVVSGVSYAAFRLFQDVQGGIFERFHSMPVARSTVLWGHVLSAIVANLASLVIVVAVAFGIGFRPHAGVGGWLGAVGILLLFNLALVWVAVIAGLVAKTPDGAGAFSYPLIFLPFVSSAFVPTASMPTVVRAFAQNQPVTSIVDTLRRLLGGQPAGSAIWIALAWLVAIALVAFACAMRAYRRKI
jgi:ABC-2 type transport system permease protein